MRENIKNRIINPATAHVLMVSFLLGGVGALLFGLQQSLHSAENSVRGALKAVIFIQPGMTDLQAEAWVKSLPATDPEIESVRFISRTEALDRAQANPSLAKSLVLLRDNPFPATAVVRYKDAAWLDRVEPGIALRGSPQIQEIRWDAEARSVFRSLRQWRAWLLRLTVFALLMMGIWCLFGLYRFFAMNARPSELLIQLGVGLIGGSLSVVTWGLALRGVGVDAALYKPASISFWPLATAVMAALATFGWKVDDHV